MIFGLNNASRAAQILFCSYFLFLFFKLGKVVTLLGNSIREEIHQVLGLCCKKKNPGPVQVRGVGVGGVQGESGRRQDLGVRSFNLR